MTFCWNWCLLSTKIEELHDDLPFLPERKKLKKYKKLVTNLRDKNEHVVQIKN